MPRREETSFFLPPHQSPSVPLFLLLPLSPSLLSMCLPLSTPLLISPPYVATHRLPHSLQHPLHLIATPFIPSSWLPPVLPTTPHLSLLPPFILPSIVPHPTLLPHQGPHPPFNHPSTPSHQLQWLTPLSHVPLPFSSPPIPSVCSPMTAMVSVSLRSCTGDTKQLRNQQRPRPCRQSLK